jgi:hypothetical protein
VVCDHLKRAESAPNGIASARTAVRTIAVFRREHEIGFTGRSGGFAFYRQNPSPKCELMAASPHVLASFGASRRLKINIGSRPVKRPGTGCDQKDQGIVAGVCLALEPKGEGAERLRTAGQCRPKGVGLRRAPPIWERDAASASRSCAAVKVDFGRRGSPMPISISTIPSRRTREHTASVRP